MSDPLLKKARAILAQHDAVPCFSKGDAIAAFRALLAEHQADTHHMDMCHVCAAAGAALAGLNGAALGATVPAGFALVPIEPTAEQLQVKLDFAASGCQMGAIYRAMISAAPTSVTQQAAP